MSVIDGSDSVGPKAQIMVVPSQAVAVRGEESSGEENFMALWEMLRRFLMVAVIVRDDKRCEEILS